jgi:hypothetical protein
MSVSLATIVTAICSRVGIDAADIDVTDLEEIYIQGYVITRVMTAADAIEPLRKAGFFDIVEDGERLKFVTRGKAVVRTLTTDDIGAHDGTNDTPPAAVVTRMMQDVELPRLMRVHFRNEARDYEPDQALSPSRLITRATNVVDLELPMTVTETQAAKIAEVLWSEAWAGRFIHQTAVDQTHADLEPSDCVYVPVDGRLERCRILSIDDSQMILRKLELARDDDGSYVSEAIADAPEREVTSGVVLVYRTTLTFMDLPPLRTEDTDAGFYVAARRSGTRGNAWRGAVIYRSTDGGTVFEEITSVASEAVAGSLSEELAEGTLPTGSPFSFDEVNTLRILLPEWAELSSRTDNELDNGANTAAIGVNGRWEILQFGTATQISETEWELSHLLRGRRGTEHVMGTSVPGDQFVLISGGGIVRIPLQAAQIGEEYVYKAVSFGQDYADGVDFEHAGTGETLRPFSPTGLDFSQVGPDLAITWTGRDRLGQELVYFGTDPESDPPTTYEIDIATIGSPGGVVRTLTSTSEAVTYPAALMAADGVGGEFTATVYQISHNDDIGRGTASDVLLINISMEGTTSLAFTAAGRASRVRNARGTTSITFTPEGELEGISGAESGTFTITAEQGADVLGYGDAGFFGSQLGTLDADTLLATVRAFYVDQLDAPNYFLYLLVEASGGGDPGDSYIDSIRLTGNAGLVTLNNAAAETPGGAPESGGRLWIWSLGAATLLDDTDQYVVTVNP